MKTKAIRDYADCRREYASVYWALRRGQLGAQEGNACVNAIRGIVNAFEAESGSTFNLNHSGGISVESLDSAFGRIFGAAKGEAPAVSSQLDAGQVQTPGVEKG